MEVCQGIFLKGVLCGSLVILFLCVQKVGGMGFVCVTCSYVWQ